jgi:DNA-binding CsgD family transcriptional regulator
MGHKQALNPSSVSRTPMPSSDTKAGTARDLFGPWAVLIVQIVAATYFVVDGVEDIIAEMTRGISLGAVMECLIAFALLGGIVMATRYIRQLQLDMRRNAIALASARGALGDHIASRFAEWRLTPGESDVAMFALKGCDVAEIARLRGAATGTVRAQLSQVYAKAGVTSQSMLMSLFIEDLLG